VPSAKPSLQGVQVREEHLLQGHWSPGPPGRVPFQLEGLEPAISESFLQPEEPRLRQTMCSLEQLWAPDV